jgi:cobyrinic acid a,c-diamide synthase
MRTGVKRLSEMGMPIYGECGGMMYLGTAITDLEGQLHPMTNCIPIKTKMLQRLKSLGYREVRLLRNTVLGKSDTTIRGHEFHYSALSTQPLGVETVYRVTGRADNRHFSEGYQINNTLGSYVHLHFGSQPSAASNFVDCCLAYKSERKPAR